jgi:hypothetical protein
MEPMHVLVLGPEGAGRSALESTLARLGCAVRTGDAFTGRPEPSAADILMLDVRGDESPWAALAEGLLDDDRPVMVVSEGPTPMVRALARRSAGTVVLTGGESDAGYRVALSVLRALRERALERAARGRDGTLTGLAAL